MLILTRKPGESLYIGDSIKITIVEMKGHQIRVGIDAPSELRIYREEIYLQILEENRKAAAASSESDEMEGLESLLGSFAGRASDRKPLGAVPVRPGTLTGKGAPAVAPEVVVKRKRGRKSDE